MIRISPKITEKIDFIKQKTLEYYNKIENRHYAAFSYFPFIGWLFPLYLREEDSLCQEHAKQGLVLAVFFTAPVLFFSLINIFLYKSLWEARLTIVIIIYLLYLAYFTFCTIGALRALKERSISFPFFSRYSKALKI